jgi:hypothetical protein
VKLKLALLSCKDCGKRALAVVDDDGELTRITNSKCHNSWRNVNSFDVDVPAEFMIHEECPVHEGSVHGQEAEELRVGVATIVGEQSENAAEILDDLQRLLDNVDARDSLAFLERKKERKARAKRKRA